MANCYRCGCYLEPRERRYRRRMPTGSSIGLYGTRRVGLSVRQYSGLRTVCWVCAREMDRASTVWFFVLLALGGLVLWWILSRPSQRFPPPPPLRDVPPAPRMK